MESLLIFRPMLSRYWNKRQYLIAIDLLPFDFFFSGYLKSKFYTTALLEEVRQTIFKGMRTLTNFDKGLRIISKMLRNVGERFEQVHYYCFIEMVQSEHLIN